MKENTDRIVDIKVHLLRSIIPAVEMPSQGGSRRLDVSSVLLEVYTDQGIVGVGESFYRSVDDSRFLAESVRSLGRHLIGKDPFQTAQRWHEVYVHAKRSGGYGALSALDEALWDIKGKHAGLPIYQLLGGKTTPVRAYGTYPLARTADELEEGARWLSEHAFAAIKVPVGYGVKEDSAFIRDMKERLPQGFQMAIDANTSYAYPDALAVGKVAEECDLAWFEEPIEHMDVHGNAELNRRLNIPISGYQTHNTHYPALEMLKADSLDIYQPSLDYVGGVTAAYRVAVLVDTFGKRLVPHTMGPVVNFAASLHVAAATRSCTLIEFPVLSRDVANPGNFHAGPYVKNVDEFGLQPDGTISPPDRPGIGVEIDWDAVREVEEREKAA